MAFLFPADVRLSTWIPILVFACLAVVRRNHRPLLAMVAWLFGFEAVFQLLDVAEGFPLHWPHLQFFVLAASILVTVGVTIWSTWAGVKPDLRILTLALIFLIAWAATGFHVNYHNGHDFDITAEVLNEASKTLWAVAYLLPLRKGSQHGLVQEPESTPRSQEEGSRGHALTGSATN